MNFFCWLLILSFSINHAFSQQDKLSPIEPMHIQQRKVDNDHPVLMLTQVVDTDDHIKALNKIANAYRKENKWDSALYFQRKAAAMAKSSEDIALQAKTWKNLGYTHWKRHNIEEALDCYEKVLSLYLQMNDKEAVAQGYYDVGLCLKRLGKFKIYISYQSNAIQFWKETSHYLYIAKAFQNLGMIYQMLGDIEKAVAVLEEALPIFIDLQQPNQAAYCYMLLGHISIQQRQLETALNYYENALEIQQQLNNSYGIISSLISIGMAYQNAGDYAQALHYFRHAWAQNLANEFPDLLAYTYDGIGSTQRLLYQYDSAIHYLNKALTLRQQLYGEQHPDVSIIHAQLAQTYLKSNTLSLALAHAQQALFALEVAPQENPVNTPEIGWVSSPPLLLDALSVKADVLAAMGYLPAALQHYQQGIRYLMHQTVNGLDFSEDQLSMIDRYRPLFEGGIRTAYTLYQNTGQDEYLSHAFAITEASKAFLLRKAVQHNQTIRYAGVPENILVRETALKQAVTFHKKELYTARQAEDTAATLRHRKQLVQNQEAYNNLKDTLAQQYPAYYRLSYDTAFTNIADVQHALPPHEMLLSYFAGEQHLYGLTLTRDTVHIFQKTADTIFTQHLSNVRKVLTDYAFITDSVQYANRLYTHSATWLFRVLVQPSLSVSKGTLHTLTIVPDGPLNTIPFEALLQSVPEDLQNYRTWPYLVKDYAIGYAYAATLSNIHLPQENKLHTFAGFAPDYSDSAINNNTIYSSFSQNDILPLPEAGAEIKAIADIMGGRVYTKATTENFSLDAPQSQVIHFSGHALLDDNNNTFSHLVFTPKDTSGNHLLYAADIYNMPLNAEMVVLSACNSGYGTVKNGEGIMSLARAFAYAGCRSLVGSLWKVPDHATKRIMIDFYTHLADDSKKDRALQQAKLQYLQKATLPHAHPFYWAGFIAIGDTQPLRQQKHEFTWYVLGGMLFLVVGAFWWKR